MLEQIDNAVLEPQGSKQPEFSTQEINERIKDLELDFDVVPAEEALDIRAQFDKKMAVWTDSFTKINPEQAQQRLADLRPVMADVFLNEHMANSDGYNDEQKAELAHTQHTLEQTLMLDQKDFTKVYEAWKTHDETKTADDATPEVASATELDIYEHETNHSGIDELAAADETVMRIKKENPEASTRERAIYWDFLTTDEYNQLSDADLEAFEAQAEAAKTARNTTETPKSDLIDIEAEFGYLDEDQSESSHSAVYESQNAKGGKVEAVDVEQEAWNKFAPQERNEKKGYKLSDRLRPSYWMAKWQAHKAEFGANTSIEDKQFHKILNRVTGAIALTSMVIVTVGAAKGYFNGDEHAALASLGSGHDLAPHGQSLHEAIQPNHMSANQAHAMNIHAGEGGHELAHNLGKTNEWWNNHASTLAKNFPSDFYRVRGGGVGIAHVGSLSEAAQRYLISH